MCIRTYVSEFEGAYFFAVVFFPLLLPREQFVVNLKGSGAESAGLSAIVPQMQVAGTITRRAVEPTWLTASNPKVCVVCVLFP